MNRWILIGVVVATLLFIVVALLAYGRARWSEQTARLTERLESARVEPHPTQVDFRELENLPSPVQRYFRLVLRDGAPMVAAVTVRQEGTFNMSEIGEQWKLFASVQRVVTQRPGFAWDGRIAILPGIGAFAHDAYVAGEGLLHPSIAGLITLTELRGGGDIAHGEFTRFLAEAAWYPTALLPSQGTKWQSIDERSARASLADGDASATLVFYFGTDGLIEAVRADARGRAVAGKIIQTPWEGRWQKYQVQNGLRIPLSGEVSWLLPEGRRPYWRGTITRIAYEFTR